MQYDNLARDGETRSRVRKQTSCRVSMRFNHRARLTVLTEIARNVWIAGP